MEARRARVLDEAAVVEKTRSERVAREVRAARGMEEKKLVFETTLGK